MTQTVKVFVTYSHKDSKYLSDESLLGFLKGLEKEGVEFWTDLKLRPGELWDDAIKANLENSRIALVLVSQAFLDSDYCQKVEIENFLAQKAHLFPIILSPCEWRRHAWLKSRQHLPGGDETIEENYTDAGARKRLFLKVREYLRERVEEVRHVREALAESSAVTTAVSAKPALEIPGKVKVQVCRLLGDDWRMLADYLEIPPYDQARFDKGNEARQIWEWLWNRQRLDVLPEALSTIGREDLAEIMTRTR